MDCAPLTVHSRISESTSTDAVRLTISNSTNFHLLILFSLLLIVSFYSFLGPLIINGRKDSQIRYPFSHLVAANRNLRLLPIFIAGLLKSIQVDAQVSSVNV